MNGLGATRDRSIAAAVNNNPITVGNGLKSTATAERSLERNPSVLSRKELIKHECNLLLETRLPNIMHLMNSEKSLGLNYMDKIDKIGNSSPIGKITGSKGSKKQQSNMNSQENLHQTREQSKEQNHRSKSINVNQFTKQSMDLDDPEYLEKMFSHVDSDIRDLSKLNNPNLANQNQNHKSKETESN